MASSIVSETQLAAPNRPLRQARWATAVLFFTNGALFANIVPRFPEIKDSLGMTNSLYGLTMIAFSAGAITAGLAAAPLVRRFGAANTAIVGTILTGVFITTAGLGTTPILFAAAMLVAGMADAVTDVAQNSHGLAVQRRYGRSILNSFHAIWSAGAVTGGLMSAAAIKLAIPLPWHLTVSAALFATCALVVRRYCLTRTQISVGDAEPNSATQPNRTPFWRARPVGFLLTVLGVLAISGAVVEETTSSWAALYLRNDLGAAEHIAALGFVSMMVAHFLGRIFGDKLVDRFGQRKVAQVGGLAWALGMGIALLFPAIPGTLAGFAIAGLGAATIVPAAMGAADQLPGLRPGTGLTVVSWIMRVGFLASPPLVGWIADHVSLRIGLLALPMAGIAVLVFSGVLDDRRAATANP